MPKTTLPNPQFGVGQEPFTQANYTLSVGTLSGDNILIASPQQTHDAGVDPTFMLMSHVQDPHAAHPASAISVEDIPAGTFNSDNVQGVLQELSANNPAQPANVGEWMAAFPYTTGIPDWGNLGLNTGAQTGFDVTPTVAQSHVYPYQWVPPVPANRTNLSQLGPFEPPPASTAVPPYPPTYFEFNETSGSTITARWNAGGFTPRDTVFNVEDTVGDYSGGGVRSALAGAFRRVRGMVQTYRVVHADPAATVFPVVVTGVVAPADRGVLALIRWPADGKKAEFLAQTVTLLTDSVIAAIVLGQGLYGEGTCPTDGEAGGLFLTGSPDAFAWPGQATGQAGLAEIYRGVAATFGPQTTTDSEGASGLGPDNYIFKDTSPYWNFDGRVSEALSIVSTALISAYIMEATLAVAHTFKIGQPITIVGNGPDIPDGTYTVESIPAGNIVRLWASGAGGGAGGGTAQRITGCDVDDYPADGIPFPGQVRLGTVAAAGYTPIAGGVPILGAPWLQGAVRGTPAPTAPTTTADLDNNFFQYRLPVLADYSNTPTGLPYTPLLEKPRYYTKPPLADNTDPLDFAGNFTDYAQDYYPYQVARFRHRFEVPAISTLNDAGSYILLHFKKEEYFEDLLVRGIWPTDDKLYSANATNVTDIIAGVAGLDDVQASTAANMIDQTTIYAMGWVNGSINGKPFFNLCGSVVVDKTDIVVSPPTITAGPTYSVTTIPAVAVDDWIHTVSGVAYFAAKDNNDQHCIELDTFTLTANNLFGDGGGNARAFLTGNPNGSFDPARIMTMTPMMMHLGDFFGVHQTYTATPTNGVWLHDQHIEMAIEAIAPPASVGGVAPLIAATASIPAFSVYITGPAGSATNTVFSTNAKPHAFLRTPLSHTFTSITDGVNLAQSAIGLLGGDSVLYSSTTRDAAANPNYGNLVDPVAVAIPPLWPTANPSLFIGQKQSEERFLDETYRYRSDFGSIAGVDNLIGPGMPLPAAAIEIPSKAGVAVVGPAPTSYDWPTASWFQGGTMSGPCWKQDLSIIANGFATELQVAGTPHRNPPIGEGVLAPKPSTGMLLYPKVNYTTGHRPNFATDVVTQYDYTFNVFDRSFVRVLDLSDSDVAAGTPFALLRFNGLTLDDFAYGGGATAGSANMAILAKVPGLTTWMDVGRVDGAGPSKQDPLLDGAGCMVLGPDTKNITSIYGHPVAQVKINVGPVANFFKCMTDPQCEDEIPLLIKVVYYCPHAVAFLDVRDNTVLLPGDNFDLNDGIHFPLNFQAGVDFAVGGTAAITATNIATAINAAIPMDVTAQAVGSRVYLMSDQFGTAGTAANVQCFGPAPIGLSPTALTFFTGGCESDKYDLSYQVTSAAGVTPVVFDPAPSEDYKSSEVRGLLTVTTAKLP